MHDEFLSEKLFLCFNQIIQFETAFLIFQQHSETE